MLYLFCVQFYQSKLYICLASRRTETVTFNRLSRTGTILNVVTLRGLSVGLSKALYTMPGAGWYAVPLIADFLVLSVTVAVEQCGNAGEKKRTVF